MAILKLKYNSALFENLEAAKAGVAAKMNDAENPAQVGEFWAGEYNNGAVLAFKGANGVVVFSDASAVTAEFTEALENYYTKEEIDELFNTKLADYYTKDEVDGILEGYYTKEEVDGLVAGAKEHAENLVSAIKITKEESATAVTYKLNGASEESVDIVVDKDDSLKSVQLGTITDGEFVESATGEVIRFVYNLADGTEKTVDINMSHVITEAELNALAETMAGDGLVAENGVLKVVAGDYISVSADAVAVDFDAVDAALVAEGTEVASAIATANQAAADAKAAGEQAASDAKATIDEYTVNGLKISENPELTAAHIGVTKTDKLASENVQDALEELQSEIASAVAGGVNTIVEGDAIEVDATDVNNPKVSVLFDGESIGLVDNKLTVLTIDCGTY